MANRPYMSNKPVASKLKPLNITEPEGKTLALLAKPYIGELVFACGLRFSCWLAAFNRDLQR